MTARLARLSLAIVCLLVPLAKLRLGFSLLTGSMNAVRGLPALWGMVTGSVSLLGGAIGALVQSGWSYRGCACRSCLLIWKYWDPIRAFFAGVFAGLWKG
ncbi:hypothetical protein [Escherichia coli]|uniref:hypothetical protein n=1 Tax=Escherichia coli TaxID=562 RepID=UPI002021D0C0|nr:hypothetical protein [Escherichia coli]